MYTGVVEKCTTFDALYLSWVTHTKIYMTVFCGAMVAKKKYSGRKDKIIKNFDGIINF